MGRVFFFFFCNNNIQSGETLTADYIITHSSPKERHDSMLCNLLKHNRCILCLVCKNKWQSLNEPYKKRKIHFSRHNIFHSISLIKFSFSPEMFFHLVWHIKKKKWIKNSLEKNKILLQKKCLIRILRWI